jgi:hypothetical protein
MKRVDLPTDIYLSNLRILCQDNNNRRRLLETFFAHPPDGSCHWPKCTNTFEPKDVDADAFFCSECCPICSGDWTYRHKKGHR